MGGALLFSIPRLVEFPQVHTCLLSLTPSLYHTSQTLLNPDIKGNKLIHSLTYLLPRQQKKTPPFLSRHFPYHFLSLTFSRVGYSSTSITVRQHISLILSNTLLNHYLHTHIHTHTHITHLFPHFLLPPPYSPHTHSLSLVHENHPHSSTTPTP